MKRSLHLAILFFVLMSSAFGQQVVQGKVVGQHTGDPIAYANIGILNSNIGTLSNADGSFQIRIPEKHLNDTLTFAALGYRSNKIIVHDFLQTQENTVHLIEKVTLLETVTVTERKQKNKIVEVGNSSSRGGVLEEDTTYAGRSIALLIDNTHQKEPLFPAYIQNARLRIFRNNLPACRFRVRLNEVDAATGKPGNDILQKSIVVESSLKNGWIEFDLSSLNLIAQHPFFVTFEQILDLNDRTKIADGYRQFMHQHPEKLKIDTVVFEGKKEPRLMIKGSGVDLPGTFIAIRPNAEGFTCYERKTSLGEWIKVRGIVTATVTLSNQPVTNSKPSTNNCESLDCRLKQLTQEFLNESGMNGMQLCVSKGNKVVASIAVGLSDKNTNTSTSTNTRFRINSISKSMTAAALIKLMEEYKFDLDAPIRTYVPEFPEKKYPVTTRQLAGHLSGIRDYHEDDLTDFVRHEHYTNALSALSTFKNDSLLFKPGTRFHYSGFGFNLIGAAIEKVSGLTYEEFMQKKIWKPLKLSNTSADDLTKPIPNRSKFYDAAGNENEYGDWSYKYPAGGLLSTAEDLVRFGNEMLNGSYFNHKLKALLFQSKKTSDQKETGYGLGWYIGVDAHGNRIWHHEGDSFSSSSHLILYPDQNIVIAFLGNSQAGVNFDWQRVADMVMEGSRAEK